MRRGPGRGPTGVAVNLLQGPAGSPRPRPGCGLGGLSGGGDWTVPASLFAAAPPAGPQETRPFRPLPFLRHQAPGKKQVQVSCTLAPGDVLLGLVSVDTVPRPSGGALGWHG